MNNQQIHLAVAFDEKYLVPFYVLITSIFESNKHLSFQIHCITSGISKLEKDQINQFANTHNSSVLFYKIGEEDLKDLALKEGSRVTKAAYFRLFFSYVLPETITKYLYLDTDLIVIGNIERLYETDISGFPVAAVAEVNATINRPDLGIYETGVYFNSGVMLINNTIWKEQEISFKALEYIRTNPDKIKFWDQDALNVVLHNNYLKLDGIYNVIPFDIPQNLAPRNYKQFLNDKVIIHFCLKAHKPWKFSCRNRLRYLYYYYLGKSPKAGTKRYLEMDVSRKTIISFIKIRTIESLLNFPGLVKIIRRTTHKQISIKV